MTDFENMRSRLSTGRHIHTDIKHKDFLSQQDIQDIPISLVFEWISTGRWKKKDFDKWLKALRVIE